MDNKPTLLQPKRHDVYKFYIIIENKTYTAYAKTIFTSSKRSSIDTFRRRAKNEAKWYLENSFKGNETSAT